MKTWIKFLAAAVLAITGCAPLHAVAQSTSAIVVAACGTPPTTYAAGTNKQLTQDTTGTLCSTGSGGGGGGSNAAAGLTGAAVPTSAGYTGFNSGGNLVGVSSSNPLPVNLAAPAVPSTGGNLTITTGGTYQLLLASNTARIGCTVRNPSTATEPMSVRIGTSGAIFDIPAGANFGCGVSGQAVSISDAIYVTAPTSGHAFEENFQ